MKYVTFKKVVFFKDIKKWEFYNLTESLEIKGIKLWGKKTVLIDIRCLFLLVINFC